MSLTKEQKDGLISNLYAPMFDYIEGIVKHEDEPGIFARLFKKAAKKSAFGLAFELRQAAIYDYEAKAKFESRISAIIDAYLERRVLAEPLPLSQPVADAVSAAKEERRAEYVRALAQIKWQELSGFWYKAKEEKERLWPHYHAAELLIDQAWIHGRELLKKQEDVAGVKWDDIAHSPASHWSDVPLEECAICTAYPEVIEAMRASGDIEPDTDD